MKKIYGTTIISVRKDGKLAMGGDGQVTFGNTIMKGNARKVRRLYQDKVLAGFAGGTADAFTLFERFEGKLEQGVALTGQVAGRIDSVRPVADIIADTVREFSEAAERLGGQIRD